VNTPPVSVPSNDTPDEPTRPKTQTQQARDEEEEANIAVKTEQTQHSDRESTPKEDHVRHVREYPITKQTPHHQPQQDAGNPEQLYELDA
jgi:hypothetical protein